jgi:hypothetical protein
MGRLKVEEEANHPMRPHTDKVSGPPPLHHAAPPRLASHQQHLSGPPSRPTPARTQPPATQTAQGKPFTDHGHRTKIKNRHPSIEVKPPPLRRIYRADNLTALATQDYNTSNASTHVTSELPTHLSRKKDEVTRCNLEQQPPDLQLFQKLNC